MRFTNEKRDDNVVELESQVILRLPPEPAAIIRDLIRSGMTNFKDRVSVRLENDLRHGEVRIDQYLLHAKVYDLPTVLESLKTIDNKSFYKTADICQIVICKEEEDDTTDEESANKTKKKDPIKVDKKFLYPHGITPPLKNVRRRRFRKTLRKKFVEQPEIEKEVKRLLRVDNDAASVKWEVIYDDDQKPGTSAEGQENLPKSQAKEPKGKKDGKKAKVEPAVNVEQEIFGSAVSDSEDENIKIVDIEDDDSRLYDSDSRDLARQRNRNLSENNSLMTSFDKDMFMENTLKEEEIDIKDEMIIETDVAQAQLMQDEGLSASQYDRPSYSDNIYGEKPDVDVNDAEVINDALKGLTNDQILARMCELRTSLAELRTQQQQQEMELAGIENQALRLRFQEIYDQSLQEIFDKEIELQELENMLR